MNSSNNGNQGHDLWTNGLICAFEFCRGRRKMAKYSTSVFEVEQGVGNRLQRGDLPDKLLQITRQECKLGQNGAGEEPLRSYWRPIGWDRVSELVQSVHIDNDWKLQNVSLDENEVTVAELASPYWERPAGPTWWCHVDVGHQGIISWLRDAQWLHPAISVALRDESKLISERMKHLFYEVPVRVAGGLLFELVGQSAGDPFIEEDDIPIVLRSWQAQNFVVTALHVKGFASNISVLGITEVQEMLLAGGECIPRTVHELIAHLACRLARWDDRLFRKYIFGAADEVELKFMNRRMHEDLNLFTIILNQEIQRLSTQVIRVKWSLHAREEIIFELLQQLKGNTTKDLLEGTRKSTRQMIIEQEAVRGRLFTIQDVMQNTVRAWLQDRSLTVTHNLGIFGGVGLLLTIATGLFGINVDGIPGAKDSPQAFALFSVIVFISGLVLVIAALLYLGLKEPKKEENVEVIKLELDEMIRKFQVEAESHAKVRKNIAEKMVHTAATPLVVEDPNGYVLMGQMIDQNPHVSSL